MLLPADVGRTIVGLATECLWATESEDLSVRYGAAGFRTLRSASVR